MGRERESDGERESGDREGGVMGREGGRKTERGRERERGGE